MNFWTFFIIGRVSVVLHRESGMPSRAQEIQEGFKVWVMGDSLCCFIHSTSHYSHLYLVFLFVFQGIGWTSVTRKTGKFCGKDTTTCELLRMFFFFFGFAFDQWQANSLPSYSIVTYRGKTAHTVSCSWYPFDVFKGPYQELSMWQGCPKGFCNVKRFREKSISLLPSQWRSSGWSNGFCSRYVAWLLKIYS